MIYWW